MSDIPNEVWDEFSQSLDADIDAWSKGIVDGANAYEDNVGKRQQDAPNYRESTTSETCKNCAHGGDGYCDLFKINTNNAFTCDAYEPLLPKYHSWTPPVEVQENAKKALEVAATASETASTELLPLIRQLANGTPLNTEQVQAMYDYLNNNYEVANKESWNSKGAEYQEWWGLGGRAGLSWSKKVINKGVNKMDMETEATGSFEITADIAKVDDENHVVYGWASVSSENGKEVVDKQYDTISDEDLEKAAWAYMLKSREAGEMHERKTGIGKVVASLVLTKELKKQLGITTQDDRCGWIIGFNITDNNVWKSVKSGEYSAFSIGGKGNRRKVA